MSYTIENLEKSMAKLVITVSAEEFEKGMVKSFRKNVKRIDLPGFRRGKAPRKMIEKMFGPDIFYEDAANFVIPDAYEEAAGECGLDIVSRPEIDVIDIGEGKEFVFSALVAVKPEVELGEYKGVEVEKKDVRVEEEDIDAELEKVRDQNSRMITVDDRGIEEKDTALIDYEGFVEGKPFQGGKGEDHSLVIGSHTFIDTFEEQLIGKKAGEDAEVNVTFPEDYHAPELKGKPALFKVKIKEVRRKELPDLDDEFASEVSEFETLQEYRESIRKSLTEQREARAKREKEEAAVEAVVESAKIEIPDPMLDEQVQQMIQDFAIRIEQQGINMEQYMQMTGLTPDSLMSQMRPEAEKRIKTRLTLEAVAQAENIEATEQDVDEEMEEMARMYQMDLNKLKEIIGEEEKQQIYMDMAVKRTVEFLGEQAVEVEKTEQAEEE